jgi:hypothetical chaperone protein
MDAALGLDFGTTNTVLALYHPDQGPRVLRFPTPAGGEVSAFRTVLSFAGSAAAVEVGPWAVEAFLEDPTDTRLIQSFKSFAASRAFAGTSIFGKRFQFEDLLYAFLRRMLAHGGIEGGFRRIAMGRPVVFAGAEPDEVLALGRYRTALERTGLGDFGFCYEPVGAAFYFARRLQGSAVVMVADFGGGTSDFSIMRFSRVGGRLEAQPLSRAGVGVAGDAFDYRIIDEVVSPRLGKGGGYRSGGKLLPVPARYYAAFARWSQLALMKGSRELREIREIARTAEDPAALARFVELVSGEHGYGLYQAVSAAKEALSAQEETSFRFEAGAILIEAAITRTDFERWIGRELASIERAMDEALGRANLSAAQVDRVFLTGGSSLVPAVRSLMAGRFGAGAIETGGEFESIASGLAEVAWAGELS